MYRTVYLIAFQGKHSGIESVMDEYSGIAIKLVFNTFTEANTFLNQQLPPHTFEVKEANISF